MENTKKSLMENVARRTMPPWLRTTVTAAVAAAVTLAVTIGAVCVLLGRDGLAVMQGWILVRWAFVEEDADLRTVSDGALSGMVSALGDRWSYYVDAESYTAMMERRSNRYVGIGITVSYENEGGLYIMAVTPNSPAEAGGLLAGELITVVEGMEAVGDARYEAVELIAGEPGDERTLTVRNANGVEREVTLILAAIPVEIATGHLTEDGIGVIRLSNFNSNSADEFQRVTGGLVEQGALALVFDMRGNGGGYVAELTEILDYLLPEGVVFRSDPRWGWREDCDSDAACVDLPFAVLVDENTYSAAELFAAQLREMAGACIVGEVTSGKGYSQRTFALFNGGAAGLSTSCYYTGGGVSLIGTGIIPDVVLSLSEEEQILYDADALEEEDDPQLQAALALLRGYSQ